MSKLPRWFQLSNYEKELSLMDWVFEIGARVNLVKNGKFDVGQSCKNIFEALVHEKSTGVPLHLHSIKHALFWAGQDTVFSEDMQFERSALSISTLGELVTAYELYKTDPLENWIYFQCLEQQYISVDLNVSDEQIIKELKVFLKNRRAESAQSKLFSKPIIEHLDEWNTFKLLALFDLMYWREISNKSLTYAEIGEAIWPEDGIEIDQRIQKKGMRMIMSVFNFGVVSQLYSAARLRGMALIKK